MHFRILQAQQLPEHLRTSVLKSPLISIIIPTKNRGHLIGETLDAVISQTEKNWECIIVDDGSTDNSIGIISKYTNTDERIRLVKRERDPQGGSVCRNIAAQNARGNYFIFLDSDDIITPEFVGERIAQINLNPTKDLIIFPSAIFYKKIGDTKKLWNILHKEGRSDLSRFLDQDNPWHTAGPVWKKEAFFQIGGFDENAQSAQDWEIHSRALILGLKYHKTEDAEENLHHFIRKHDGDSISTEKPSKQRLENRMNTFRTIVKLFHERGLHKTSLRENLIGHYFRVSSRAYSDSLKREGARNIQVLVTEGIISKTLESLLLLKLNISESTHLSFVDKAIDLILFRFYGLSNLEIPKGRTKGAIYFG